MRVRQVAPLLVVLVGVACGAGDGEPSDEVEPPSEVVDAGGPMLHPSVDDYPAAVLDLTGTDGTTETVAVRVADTVERQTHGLMEVPELPDGTGMLFVYPQDHQRAFWMKNTLVQLDIAFISAEGEILQILTMQPCEADPCPTYPPRVTYRDALEVPAGWFERVGIGEGATVTRG